jgi:hypothetical protein
MDRDRGERRARKIPVWALILLTAVLVILFAGLFAEFEYAYVPPEEKLLNPERINLDIAYDLWGRPIRSQEAEALLQTPEGRLLLSPANGAVRIDQETLHLGREAFYTETFSNEIFATDVVGFLDGPLTLWQYAKAILRLRGRGTDNLQVELARDAVVGGRTFEAGTIIDTGLDVVPGTYTILGMKMRYSRFRIQTGITCAACHSTVDMETGKVVEGAPNNNLNLGVMLALAPNSAAFFVNADGFPPGYPPAEPEAYVISSSGALLPLPGVQEMEDAVDRAFLSWPPGSFDSTVDLVCNPSQIPDSFTWGDHPYGWTGFAAAGPFLGISVLNNNVHALNSDGISQAEGSKELFGFDKELNYAIVLRNAARKRFRWDPDSGTRPSAFFMRINPTPPTMGFNENVHLPTFPRGSLISPDGLYMGKEGSTVWLENNAISAFQNTLAPPPAPVPMDEQTLLHGEAVFERAGCSTCHHGPGFTNNRVLPAAEVGASPSRAAANRNNWNTMLFPPLTWAWDTPVPVPLNARMLEVPLDRLDLEQVQLSYAQDPEGQGGFKVKGLIGLWWTPPYLHDSSIAVGPDPTIHLGVPGTLLSGIPPHPVNSLRALIDRDLRRRVIEVNQAHPDMVLAKVAGTGHEHWVDRQAGYTGEDQEALILYLLSLQHPNEVHGGR